MASGCVVVATISSENNLETVPPDPLAVTEKDVLVVPVGVPEKMPPVIVKPPRLAFVVIVHGLPHPGALKGWLKNVPTTATGNTTGVMLNGSMETEKPCDTAFDVARSVNVMFGKNVPVAVGVPEI